MYLAWGLVTIQGLTIDGEAATVEESFSKMGPMN